MTCLQELRMSMKVLKRMHSLPWHVVGASRRSALALAPKPNSRARPTYLATTGRASHMTTPCLSSRCCTAIGGRCSARVRAQGCCFRTCRLQPYLLHVTYKYDDNKSICTYSTIARPG